MATTFLNLIFVLFWPLILSAAACAIAIDALAETHKNSDVVEALTRPTGIQKNTMRDETSLLRRNLLSDASGHKIWFQVQFGRKQHTARKLARAKWQAKARTLRRDDGRLRCQPAVARRPRDNPNSETVSL